MGPPQSIWNKHRSVGITMWGIVLGSPQSTWNKHRSVGSLCGAILQRGVWKWDTQQLRFLRSKVCLN